MLLWIIIKFISIPLIKGISITLWTAEQFSSLCHILCRKQKNSKSIYEKLYKYDRSSSGNVVCSAIRIGLLVCEWKRNKWNFLWKMSAKYFFDIYERYNPPDGNKLLQMVRGSHYHQDLFTWDEMFCNPRLTYFNMLTKLLYTSKKNKGWLILHRGTKGYFTPIKNINYQVKQRQQ